MRAGGGKQKGGSFERFICKSLSLWVTNGQHDDTFWRSAMSGGRATRSAKKGRLLRRVSGDICATSPEGHEFIDQCYAECKFVKDLGLGTFIVKNKGPLQKFWTTTVREAKRHNKDPMLIAKQNGWPVLVFTKPRHLEHLATPQIRIDCRSVDVYLFSDIIASNYKDGTRA